MRSLLALLGGREPLAVRGIIRLLVAQDLAHRRQVDRIRAGAEAEEGGGG